MPNSQATPATLTQQTTNTSSQPTNPTGANNPTQDHDGPIQPKDQPAKIYPQAVGAIIFCKDTKRFLLARRSQYISDPGLWSTIGGGVDEGETLEAALKREIKEELGYSGPYDKLAPLYSDKTLESKFLQPKNPNEQKVYTTYLAIVPFQFTPKLNPENSEYRWFSSLDFRDLPNTRSLHPGLITVLKNIRVVDALKKTFNGIEIKAKFQTTATQRINYYLAQANHKATFVGTCVNSFDEDGDCTLKQLPFNTVSDLGHADEEGTRLSKDVFLKTVIVPQDLSKLLTKKSTEFICYESVYMLYDSKADIHYFFV